MVDQNKIDKAEERQKSVFSQGKTVTIPIKDYKNSSVDNISMNSEARNGDWHVKSPRKRVYIGIMNINDEWFGNKNDNESNTNIANKENSEMNLVGFKVTSPKGISFLINPESLSWNHTKQVTATPVRGSFTRPGLKKPMGHTIQHFWDELDSITGSGFTGNFMLHRDNEEEESQGGLIYPMGPYSNDRKNTLAYMQFFKIISLVKNNGCTWVTNELKTAHLDKSKYSKHFDVNDFGVIYSVGDMFIYYDDMIFWGNFDTFSYSENAEDKPFGFTFNFTFKVNYTEDGRF